MHSKLLGAALLASTLSLSAQGVRAANAAASQGDAPAPVVAKPAKRIHLRDALDLAATLHQEVRSAVADRGVAEGRLLGARAFPYNPELTVEAGATRSPDVSSSTASVALWQTVELGGKRSKRSAAASARLEAVASRLKWVRLSVAARVRRAYGLAILARHRLASSRDAEAITSELKGAATERLRLGAGTLLELNVSTAAAGRATAERLAAELSLADAEIELGAAVGDPERAALSPADDQLPLFGSIPDGEEDLVARALASRPDLQAARLEVEAAEAEIRAADSLALPNPSIGLTQSRDGLDDSRSTTLGVTFPIPLFNRNQGERAVSRAALERSRAEESATRQAVARGARAAYHRYTLTRLAVEGFDRDVVEKLGENLSLALQSFQAGKIGLLEFNNVRRELVETRLAYLGTERELIEAQAALELAAGGILEKP